MTGATGGFLLVRVGSRLLGLPLADVVEVTQLSEVRPVPVVDRSVRGLVALHGRMVPLVHLGSLIEGGSSPAGSGTLGVVVLVDDRRVCLEVDDAENLAYEPTLPVPAGETLPWAIGVARHAGMLIPLLDVSALGSRLLEVA